MNAPPRQDVRGTSTPPRTPALFVVEPSRIERPPKRRVSCSPDMKEDLSKKENSRTAPPCRRSERERHSTVIYVGNQAVKKSNNYVLKGLTYEYGGLQGNEQPQPKRRRTTLKQLTAPRRLLTLAERHRRKQSMERNIQTKQERRQSFLQQHLTVLKPFCEPKVLQRLQQQTPFQHNNVDTPFYEQPKGITAQLRDYQLEGLNWMSHMYSNNVGMILGDGK